MKICLNILIAVLCNWTCFSQNFSPNDQAKIDSLKAVIVEQGSNDTVVINSLLELAIYYYSTNPDTTITMCTQAGELSEKNNYVTGKSDSYSWLGYLFEKKGNLSKALGYQKRSLKINKETQDKLGIAHNLNNIGLIYQRRGDVATALDYFQRSLKIRTDIMDKPGIATSLNNIGFVYQIHGDVSNALAYYLRSLKIDEEIGNKKGIAGSLNNIGLIYKTQGDLDNALDYWNQSLKIREEIGDKFGIATCLNNIGFSYYSQRDLPTALEYFFKSLKIEEEIGHKTGLASSLSNIGNAYCEYGDNSQALKYFKKSLKAYEEIEDKDGIMKCLINMGHVYFEKEQLAVAEKKAKKALQLAEELGYLENVGAASDLLSCIYTRAGKYQKALKMYELFIQMKDSVNNEKTQKATIKQNMQYEFEKQSLADSLETAKELALKDIEISKQQAEAKAERITKYGLYGGLSLVLIIAFVLYRSVQQTKKANDEITAQKQEVEHRNREILDSITYAERIQSAILPPMAYMIDKLKDAFVLYKPKDIVAGDFYWLETVNDEVYFSAADCTGHGVPGAMMSVMCSNALTKSVKELGLTKPAEILDATTKIIEGRFERSEQLVLDGMDLALCKLNLKTMKLQYAGANNPLWIIRAANTIPPHEGGGAEGGGGKTLHEQTTQETLEETKADKQPIGQYDHRLPYTNHQIQLQKGDSIYIFSDGYVDQFGGPKGKKFKSKPFKKLLLSIQNETMGKQKKLIDETFENWRGLNEQVDDLCVIGVRI